MGELRGGAAAAKGEITMDQLTLNTLAQRLDRLERESRRWRWAAAALPLGIAAVVLMGQVALRRVVEAEKFVLRDPNGKERATLFTAFDGSKPGSH